MSAQETVEEYEELEKENDKKNLEISSSPRPKQEATEEENISYIFVKIAGGVGKHIVLNRKDRDNPFSSGSIGFHGSGKVQVGDKRYQVGCNVVEIGSKKK